MPELATFTGHAPLHLMPATNEIGPEAIEAHPTESFEGRQTQNTTIFTPAQARAFDRAKKKGSLASASSPQ
eukprot:3044377-Rhodomonas_salina.1